VSTSQIDYQYQNKSHEESEPHLGMEGEKEEGKEGEREEVRWRD